MELAKFVNVIGQMHLKPKLDIQEEVCASSALLCLCKEACTVLESTSLFLLIVGIIHQKPWEAVSEEVSL